MKADKVTDNISFFIVVVECVLVSLLVAIVASVCLLEIMEMDTIASASGQLSENILFVSTFDAPISCAAQ